MITTKKRRNIPREAIIIDTYDNGDIIYAINFEFNGRKYHHINHIGPRGAIKENVVFSGEYKVT